MTDYTEVLDAQISQDKPLTSLLMRIYRDNPIASFEGAAGAPDLELSALPTLVVGSSIRSTETLVIPDPAPSSAVTINSFSFIQRGTIRCRVQTDSAVNASITVVRRRAGADTTLASVSSKDYTVDISVKPGDTLYLKYTAGSVGADITGTFQTDGGDLWPGAEANVTGNSV